MLPQHEYSWGDRHPLSAVRDLPSKLRRPPAAARPVGDAGCVWGHHHYACTREFLSRKEKERFHSTNERLET